MIYTNDLLLADKSQVAWEDLMVSPQNEKQLTQLITEHRFVMPCRNMGFPLITKYYCMAARAVARR